MTIYEGFSDKPGQIKEEGQEITLRFSKIDENTGKLTWNIPPSFKGCKDGNGAYNGIVITVSDKPANYIESSPKNGQYYIGDPTVDPDLHSGSKIQKNVLVIGAFYDDRQTTELEVTDLQSRTPYYFSAYAVDNVARYHREGVHSYSLPTGPEEAPDDEKRPGVHVIQIDNDNVTINSSTGLESDKEYELKFCVNDIEYEITINGQNALTIKDLIDEINKQIILLEDPYISPEFPFINSIFFEDGDFYLWDGQNKIKLDVIKNAIAPNTMVAGVYWYNPETETINLSDSLGWDEVELIQYDFDITQPDDNTIWFDGQTAWQWESNSWCELNTIIQSTNPLLPKKLTSKSFWYDTENQELFIWNVKLKKWDDAVAIYYHDDPNNINTGDFWFNETDEIVYRFVGGTWNVLQNVRYEEPNEDGEIENPIASQYWYIPSQQKLFQRNLMNTEWEELQIVLYPTDPRDRESCEIWWNSSPSIDNIFTWDSINMEWILADNFFQTDIDPSLPEELPENSVWYNPDTGKLIRIMGTICEELQFIDELFNPLEPPLGIVWKDGDVFKVWNGLEWVEIDVIISINDPFMLPDGSYWVDNNGILWIWDGSEWSEVEVLDKSPKPDEGFFWFNSVEELLYMWEIDQWVQITGLAYVEFLSVEKINERDALRFNTRDLGCEAKIEIKTGSESVFSKLNFRLVYLEPVDGLDLEEGVPLYKRLGVGDDGSPDERRSLHDSIKKNLGHPSVTVELTKGQIDEAIDNSLLQLRKYSSLPYRRGFFFLDLRPNQQNYTLKDKCVGFNKIVTVNAIYRLRSAFLRGAYSGYDIFGYAALKQLYTLGTFDILSFHLVSSFIEELEHLFATRITFQWIENKRELRLYNSVHRDERVLVDGSIERTEQDLLTDRETALWIKRWAIAESKMMLSQERGKFQTLPGPSGSTVLNAQELITQSESEKATLMEELEDMAMAGALETGQYGYFILG